MASLSMRIPDELLAQLTSLAEATGRTKSFLVIRALSNFVEQEAWQIAEIKKALAEADYGDFATDDDMQALDAKWSLNAVSGCGQQ